jgi:hypothetical protein
VNGPGEEVLSGGYSTPVVRVEDTVRRATGPWSPAVHGLLRHLERQNFDATPRFLGFDDQGREILTFIPGEVGNYPLPPDAWSDEALVHAARLLRRYHDATVGYAPPDSTVWHLQAPFGPREVICHNDFAAVQPRFRGPETPCHHRLRHGRARPEGMGRVLRSLLLCPTLRQRALALARPTRVCGHEQAFCDTYGLAAEQRRALPEIIEIRLETLCAFIERSTAAGDSGVERVIEVGHLALYRRDIDLLRRRRDELRKSLQ